MSVRPFCRRGYTILELLVIMVLVAIGAAIAVDLRRSTRPEYIEAIVLTTDGGQVLAALNDGTVVAWDTTTGKQKSLVKPRKGEGETFGFSANGAALARMTVTQANSGAMMIPKLEVINFETGQTVQRTPPGISGTMARTVWFSNDCTRLAYVNYQNRITIADAQNLNSPDTILGPIDPSGGNGPTTFNPVGMAFADDNQKLYAASFDGQLQAWDIAANTATRAVIGPGQLGATIHQMALSPDGSTIALARIDYTAGGNPPYLIELYDASTLKLLRQAVSGTQVFHAFGFTDDGKSLAVLSDDLEIWSLDPLKPARTVKFGEVQGLLLTTAVTGDRVAVSDFMSVWVAEGNGLRKVGGIEKSESNLFVLVFAFVLVFLVWRTMRKRRTMRTCVDCGKKWREAKRVRGAQREFSQCPTCRLEHLQTDELRRQIGNPMRRSIKVFVTIAFLVAALTPWTNSAYNPSGWEMAWVAVRTFFAMLLFFVCMYVLLVVGLIAWRGRKLRGLKAERGLRKAQTVAGSEGRIERVGAMSVWIDGGIEDGANAPSEAMIELKGAFAILSAEELAAQLQDCRARLEDFIGEACPPLPESQVYIFANTAAAQKFLSVASISNEMPAVFCGPWANVGCISLEGTRRQLRPVVLSVRSLFAYQSAPWPKYGFRLGYATHNFVGLAGQPAAIDAGRRRVAAWGAEGTLLPLAQICGRNFLNAMWTATQSQLPEKYGQGLRSTHQWISLVDYFCGADATPERRGQFRKLWQTAKKARKISPALEIACECSLAELEAKWKDWAQAASFGPPAVAPSDIAEFALAETIPLARDELAPVQRRIRAIRVLANCGWSVGAETLLELFQSRWPDVQREALTALRQLSGRLGTERAEDWRPWLKALPTARRPPVDLRI